MMAAGHTRPPMHNALVPAVTSENIAINILPQKVSVYLQPLSRNAPGKLTNSVK